MSLIIHSLPDRAYEFTRERILLGDFAPGSPVRQDAIALELGVSKIPLREALARLKQDGLLTSHPNRGFVVCILTASEAEEVFALRLKLQPEAAAKACLLAGEEDRASVRLTLSSLEEKQDGDTGYHGALNRAFHMSLVKPGAGFVTYQLLERLHVLTERYTLAHRESEARLARARHEHHELVGHWFGGRVDEVASMTATHIRGALEDMRLRLTG